MKVARRADIAPFYAMEVLKAANQRAAEGGDVLHLEVGEPGAGTPRAVRAAAQAALVSAQLGYTEAFGLPELRQRIARHYADTYGATVSPERVVLTAGSSAGFVLAFLSAFDRGDRIALGVPCYPAYRNIMLAQGIEPVYLRTDASTRYQPTVAMLEAAGPVDGLLIASPANPTGTMIPPADLFALADYCEKKGIRLISDEIYHGITYGAEAATVAGRAPGAIVISGFSKYYCMTGWRLGWAVVPDDLVRAIERLQQNLFISAPNIAQRAALAAFDCEDELRANVATYAQNRALLLDMLPRAGIPDLAPADGAFYIFANVAKLTNDSSEFCRRLLADTGVAITPGIDFDAEQGHAYVRLSFAGSTATIAEAARRIEKWLKR